jgi:hypothetical protein
LTTRRELLAAGAAAALAVPAAARADTGEDRGLLEVLVRYGEALVFSYELALHNAPLQRRDKETLTKLRDQVVQADDAVRAALRRTGGTAPPRRPPAFAQLPPRIARKADRAAYLKHIVRNEEGLVSGWYASLQKLADLKLVEAAAAFMAAGGRRLVVVRNMAGLPLLPRAFENGGP